MKTPRVVALAFLVGVVGCGAPRESSVTLGPLMLDVSAFPSGWMSLGPYPDDAKSVSLSGCTVARPTSTTGAHLTARFRAGEDQIGEILRGYDSAAAARKALDALKVYERLCTSYDLSDLSLQLTQLPDPVADRDSFAFEATGRVGGKDATVTYRFALVGRRVVGVTRASLGDTDDVLTAAVFATAVAKAS